MEIGIGTPNTVAGATGAQLLEWARRADAAGFSTLATIGAVSYPGYEELTLMAAAGAVTERIRFLPNVLIAPARSTADLAKQAASVQLLTGGRLTLGLGVGWRATDYQLTDHDFATRGRRFDQQLQGLEKAWAGESLLDLDPGRHPLRPRIHRCSVPPGAPGLAAGRPIEHITVMHPGCGRTPPERCSGRKRVRWRLTPLSLSYKDGPAGRIPRDHRSEDTGPEGFGDLCRR
jgi:alkanesulfonate monooxygenase SsuD/methylene tetrahydromethanopterin reductase-like flavin-dependent oxidoreductase (luciferase family)